MTKKRSVTLLELIIAIVIIGILVVLAVPLFPKALEFTRSKQAVAALRQIYTAQRIYKIKEGFFYPYCSDGPVSEADPDILEQIFKTPLDRENWSYSIETTSLDDFTATATRTGGSAAYNGRTIVLDDDTGEPESGSWPLSVPRQ